MPSVEVATIAAASLLALAPMAVAAGRSRQASGFIYGASAALCVVVMLTGVLALIGNGPDTALTLPLGLTNLHTLELLQNSFDDLALPADMTNLQTLSVEGVTNVIFLDGLRHLRRLT